MDNELEYSSLRNEIWSIMHAVAEMGASENRKAENFQFECGGDDDDDDDSTEMAEAAEKLVKMGDSYSREYDKRKEQENLEKDITEYLLSKSNNINDKLDTEIRRFNPIEGLSGADMMTGIYGGFKDILRKFLFQSKEVGTEVEQISFVSSVTKGVSKSLKDSSSHGVDLVTVLATNFLSENYEKFLKDHGGLMKVITAANQAK